MDIQSFWQGMLAGFGIAIPVGAISVLIIDTSIRRGLASGMQAGAGAALADLIYATAAALGGTLLQAWLEPAAGAFRLVGGAALVILGSWSLLRLWRSSKAAFKQEVRAIDGARIFITFLGLTLLNPLTIIYFSALILGDMAADRTWLNRMVFVLGAGLASLSWQWLLAGFGSLAGKNLPATAGRYLSTVGYLVVLFLGIRMFL